MTHKLTYPEEQLNFCQTRIVGHLDRQNGPLFAINTCFLFYILQGKETRGSLSPSHHLVATRKERFQAHSKVYGVCQACDRHHALYIVSQAYIIFGSVIVVVVCFTQKG